MKRRVLAVGEPGPMAESVSSVAGALAVTLRAGVEQRIVGTPPSQAGWSSEADAIIRAARDEDVVGVVIDQPAGNVDWALELAAAIDRPVVFAPRSTVSPFELKRVLVPLDGSSQATAAVSRAARLFREAGADVVVLHCVHGASVPRFEDQPQYDPSDWTREFTARYLDALGDAQLEVRAGRAEDHAVEVCDAVGADIILLGWHRRPAPSRARTVRAILEHSAVPVMLLPKRTGVSRA